MNNKTSFLSSSARLDGLANKTMREVVRGIRNAERGEAQSFEFVVSTVLMVFTISLIAFAVMYWSARLPAKRAAIDCVRNAVSTLDRDIGISQGVETGVRALVMPDNLVNPATLAELQARELTILSTGVIVSNLTVEVRPWPAGFGGPWGRGDKVRCRVRYRLNVSALPMLDMVQPILNANGILEIQEVAILAIEPYKSDWR